MKENSMGQFPLRIFLCYAKEDKDTVLQLYQQLKFTNFHPWMDKHNLLPGQEWREEIQSALRNAHVVLICLSIHAVGKRGFLQREIKLALDIAEEQPDEAIWIIPVQLETCAVPERLRKYQWCNYFEADGYEKLVSALHHRAGQIGLQTEQYRGSQVIPLAQEIVTPKPSLSVLIPDLIEIPAGSFLMGSSENDRMADSDEKPQCQLELPTYYIGKTPVTNEQFCFFVVSDGYTNPDYWTEMGWQWRKEAEAINGPRYWEDSNLNHNKQPVVGINWFEAVAYCRFLAAHTTIPFRLPTEAEWEKAARGEDGLIYPWGNTWKYGYCNNQEVEKGRTTLVDKYVNGASPYGVLDMAGNVWEWCSTEWRKEYPYKLEDEWTDAYLEGDKTRMMRGGSWLNENKFLRGAFRYDYHDITPFLRFHTVGFRLVSSTFSSPCSY